MGLFEWVPIDPFIGEDVLQYGSPIIYAPSLGRALIAKSAITYYSDDGVNWSTGALIDNYAGPILWNASQSKFYCISTGPTDVRCFESTDGITWSLSGTVVSGTLSTVLTSFICNSLGTMFLMYHDGNVFVSSSGGTSWSNAGNDLVTVDAGITTYWHTMVINPTSGLITVFNIGSVISIPFATSTDGVTWTGRHGFEVLFTSNNDSEVAAYNPSGTLVSLTEISAFIMVSSDGIDWTKDGSQLPDWGDDGPEQVTGLMWSELLNKFVATSWNMVPETIRVFVSDDGSTWTEDDSVIPPVPVPIDWQPPTESTEFSGFTEVEDWERFFMSLFDDNSLTPFITAPPYDNNNMMANNNLEIEDHSLLSLSDSEMISLIDLEIMVVDAYEIIGDVELEINLDHTILIMSADCSGIYEIVWGKRNDTLYLRDADGDSSTQTVDVTIPRPFVKTAFVGG